jgi:hypothetical protein
VGKTQKLRVCIRSFVGSRASSLIDLPEELWLLFDIWLFHDFTVHLGSPIRVRYANDFELHGIHTDSKFRFSVAIFGLQNGGTAGLIYVYIGTAIGFASVVASMAEMSSM